MLKKVQGHAFAGEQRRGGPADGRERNSGDDLRAVFKRGAPLDRSIENGEHPGRHRKPGDDEVLFAAKDATSSYSFGDGDLRRDIALPEIFRQCLIDEIAQLALRKPRWIRSIAGRERSEKSQGSTKPF